MISILYANLVIQCPKEFCDFDKVFPFAGKAVSRVTITCGYFDSLLILRLAEKSSSFPVELPTFEWDLERLS